MSRSLYKRLAYLCFFALLSCSHKVVINSEPIGFEVYAGASMLGRTPVSITTDDMESTKGTNGFYLIKLKKSGYEAISVVIPRAHNNLTLDLNLRNFTATPEKIAQSSEPDAARMRRYYVDSAAVLNQQTRILDGEPPDSTLLNQLKDNYPDSSTPLFLSGLSQLIQGRKSEAQKSISEALTRNPLDDDAQALYISLTKGDIKN